MDFASLWDQLAHNIHALPQSTLMMAALAAMALGVLGSLVFRRLPGLGRLLRSASTLGLMAVLALVVLQLSRMDPRFEMAVPQLGLPEQVVEGRETRVPLAPDGHFWLHARVNGVPANFLVDTGATLTAVSADTAARVGLEPREAGIPIRMQTANGAVAAQLTTIDDLHFGNVAAHGIDAIIAPGLGPTNVIGMNLLSRLASWRVEGNTMILVPHHPQPTASAD
ncbi:MAG: TIGR02281 family clan AA aspartic protease [Porphyrobacter sp.]|nr:TIGR02281 family clan AA aspartic protease [Porphyrobacter sp.]